MAKWEEKKRGSKKKACLQARATPKGDVAPKETEALPEGALERAGTEVVPEPLAPGLYIVATPIGCLEDITLRALRTLKTCDTIVCEDTRVSFKLLKAYGIQKPLLTYHEHNADKARPHLIAQLQQGHSLALISDAGMPLIADPGFRLVRDCQLLGLHVTVVPGPTAFVTGAVLSGFPTHALAFLGFASRLKDKRLTAWKEADATLILFEAPHKLEASVRRLAGFFPERRIALVREITKLHEEVVAGTFEEVLAHLAEHTPRGEFVVALAPPEKKKVEREGLMLEQPCSSH